MDIDLDLDDLEAKARAATAGPWRHDKGGVYGVRILADKGAVAEWDDIPLSEEDANFIAAANPAVVLELVQRLRAAEGIVRDLAECDSPTVNPDPMPSRCLLCDGMGLEIRDHEPSCPYRRAVEAQP